MEETIRPMFETAEHGARAQTALMVAAFARDLVESVREFGLDATREAVPLMLRGPKTVIDGVLERLDGDDCEARVVSYLEDHLMELWWFREQLDQALITLTRHGTLMVGEDLGEMVLASVPDVGRRLFRAGDPASNFDLFTK